MPLWGQAAIWAASRFEDEVAYSPPDCWQEAVWNCAEIRAIHAAALTSARLFISCPVSGSRPPIGRPDPTRRATKGIDPLSIFLVDAPVNLKPRQIEVQLPATNSPIFKGQYFYLTIGIFVRNSKATQIHNLGSL